jgi:uncharacterized protein
VTLPSPRVASPCINVCSIDETTGLCAGCLRSLDEIAAWSVLTDEERRAVWDAIAKRAREEAQWAPDNADR